MRTKVIVTILSTLIGLGILGYVIWQSDVSKLYGIFTKLNWDFVIYALLSVFMWVGFRTLRWQNILRASGVKVKFKDLTLVSLAGLFIDCITPIYRAGSEPVRTYMLEKFLKVPSGKGFATIILDRFFDFIIYISLAVIALIVTSYKMPLPVYIRNFMYLSVGFLVAALAFVIYISLNKRLALWIVKKILKFLRRFKKLKDRVKKWESEAEAQIDSYSFTLRQGFYINLFLNMLMSVLLIAMEVIRLQLIVLALGLDLASFWILIVMGAVIIAGSIPSPPGGVGIVEPVGIGVFILAGLTISQATAIILIDRVITLVFFIFAGLGASYYLGIKKIKPVEGMVEGKK